MDNDANRLAAVISGTLLVLLLIITGVSVKPFTAVEQEHTLYVDGSTVTDFSHPSALPSVSQYAGNGPMKTALGEWLRISPYNTTAGTAAWSYPGTGREARYVCQISWTTGYTVYIAGIGILDGSAPWKSGNITLIDARGRADGQPNELHMPEYFLPAPSTSTVTG